MKNNIIFLGCTQNYGYQFSAANTKVEFLAKGLKEQGDICTIHNGIIGTSIIKSNEIKSIDKVGTVITYHKKGNQLTSWIFNLPKLAKDLKSNKKSTYNNFIILESPDYHIFLLYVLLAHLLRFKILIIAHEWGPTILSTHPLRKPSVYLFSKTFGYFVDGILPISEFIIQKIQHFKRPYIKIPITAEYNSISIRKNSVGEKYFLYCVYAAYKRVIFRIIDAYVKYSTDVKTDTKLILVLSGNDEQISTIKDYIKQVGKERNIYIKNKVPFIELMDLYANALALIIPLDPNSLQDEARFSQKIAEYLSSGSPIISNNVGEIKYYFEDKKNIILCDYSADGFMDAFKWVTHNPDKAKRIGINGFNLGKINFDYRELGDKLHNFMLTLL